MKRPLIPFAILAMVILGGCNSQDAKDITSDAGKLAETAGRSAANAGVAAKVNTMLGLHKDVDISGLHIEAEGGKVTVGGHVRTKQEKSLVLNLANKTRGVDKVIDDLRVEP